MLYLITGTDRETARTAAKKQAGKEAVVITDAHSCADMEAVLASGGMFSAGKRQAILDGVFAVPEMRERVLTMIETLRRSPDTVVILEEKLDAATKKILEKYAETSKKYDSAKRAERSTIFALANALERRDKKALWVGYQRELSGGAAPEAIHGVLFWAAKQMLGKAGRDAIVRERARALVAYLAELPHETRRRGGDLSYALEAFALSGM
jgi:hypothetical protein